MKDFIKNSFYFIIFLIKLIYHGHFRNPIKKEPLGTIAVLANGPSLKDIIPNLLIKEEFKDVDYIVLNFFAFDNIFFKIKPKYYCFADPMFFHENHRIKDVRKLFSILENEVDWNLTIFIPSPFYHSFVSFSQLKNKNINIIKINNLICKGFPNVRNFFYKKGLAAPPFGSVANLAIFVALNKGYTNINLYGVDHTFFESLCINDKNQLCNRDIHFYNNDTAVLKPILRNDNNEPWKISEYLKGISLMFEGHDLLLEYSQYLGSNILNCTENSMIDSYKRYTNN